MPGRKVFAVQELLTSADVNGYLMDQTVPRFTNTTQRDGQWPSAPDGALCVTTDTNTLWRRVSGSWVAVPPLPAIFATTAARDSQWTSPPDGSSCVTTDTNTRWQRIGGVWVALDAVYGTNIANTTFGSTATVVNLGSTSLAKNTHRSGNRIIIDHAGIYQVAASFSIYCPNATATGQIYMTFKRYNAGAVSLGNQNFMAYLGTGGAWWTGRSMDWLGSCAVGDQLEWTVNIDTPSANSPYVSGNESSITVARVANT